VLLSIIAHLVAVVLILTVPKLAIFQAIAARQEQEEARRRAEMLERQRQQQPRFVFMQPRLEMPPPRVAPRRPELSDRDRVAGGPERAQDPTNSLPFSRGNSPERIESAPPSAAAPAPAPAPPEEPASQPAGEESRAAAAGNGGNAAPLPQVSSGSLTIPRDRQQGTELGKGGGVIGDALRNIQRYATGERFQNLGGGADQNFPTIQFDSKGVEFGPWIRRFVAQVKRNWMIPYAAMSMRGHVVLTFFVHKDGRITELTLAGPSGVDAFNNAAYNALAWSNPTQPLPPEYPDDRAFFTVTFFYNEQPPQD
jgi:TonB family protein